MLFKNHVFQAIVTGPPAQMDLVIDVLFDFTDEGRP